jgi:hypothetical protein
MTKPHKNYSTKESQPKGSLNFQWETIISVIALLISVGSFLFSMQTEKAKSSPNVQVQSVDGNYLRNSGNTEDSITIICAVVLENIGNAPTQIVDVRWEFTSPPELRVNLDGRLAISDRWDPLDKHYDEYFQSIQNTPIEGIKKTILGSGESTTLNLAFFSTPVPDNYSTLQNIRVVFTFSNGQQITVLPELKYFAG